MYANFADAASVILSTALHYKNVQCSRATVRLLEKRLAKTLSADTGKDLYRADYLGPDRIRRLLDGSDKSLRANVITLFPKTWDILKEYAG